MLYQNMNHVEGGAYKLLFLLPIFSATRKILLLGLELEGLRRRLAAAGLDVCSSSTARDAAEAADGKYDIIIVGALLQVGSGNWLVAWLMTSTTCCRRLWVTAKWRWRVPARTVLFEMILRRS